MKAVKRDWGRGMATAGRTKECKTVDKHHFGSIPGIEVGMSWQYRYENICQTFVKLIFFFK